MGRNWQPKYRYRCPRCQWRGKRTRRMATKPCPRCAHYPVEREGE
jgi:hypothetical protein